MLKTAIFIAATLFALDALSQEIVLHVLAPIEDDLWSSIAFAVLQATP